MESFINIKIVVPSKDIEVSKEGGVVTKHDELRMKHGSHLTDWSCALSLSPFMCGDFASRQKHQRGVAMDTVDTLFAS
jgi:hypothetical protein